MKNFISIRQNLIKSFNKFFFAPLIISGIIISIILFYVFDNIEFNKNIIVLQNLQKKFERDNESLRNLLIEWVDYEAPVKYFHNQYPDFVEKELLISVINLNLQLFVSINENNTIKEIYFFDKEGNSISVPEEINSFFRNQNVTHLKKRNDAYWNILRVKDKLLIFAVSGVLWSQEQHRFSHGTFIFGRFLDQKTLENYSRDINYQIELIPIEENVDQKYNLNNLNKPVVVKKSLFENIGYVTIQDFFGKPVFYLKVIFPKEIIKTGLPTIFTIIIIGGIITIIASFFLKRAINDILIQRLEVFSNEIIQIKANSENKNQIQISKINNIPDEITILQENFNQMFLNLKEAEKSKEAYIQLLEQEKEKTYNLLINILPKSIAQKLITEKESFIAEEYIASVLFADIVNFTGWSKNYDPKQLVTILNQIFSEFDLFTQKYNIEKIKTIGDSYMAACGLPNKEDAHADKIIFYALDMIQFLNEFNQRSNLSINMRFGINSGKVIGGIIGSKKFIFDIWGDTVNIASRMESTSLPNQLQISETTYEAIQDKSLKQKFVKVGKLKLKSGHEIQVYRLTKNEIFVT